MIFADFPLENVWGKAQCQKAYAIPVSQMLENNPEYENLLA